MAIDRAKLSAGDIGMVISGSCSPEMCLPAEATRIARALGLNVPSFDIQSACSTFGAQVHFLERMGQNLPEYVLLVLPENMTRAVDFSDRTTAVLFGDATSAVVVSSRIPSRARTVYTTYDASPEGCDEVTMKRVGYFWQNGAAVHRFAIKKMGSLLCSIRDRLEPERKDHLIFVGHQANLPMLENVCRRAEIAQERHLFNIVEYGNQSAAGAPVVLSQNWDRFQSGDVVALVVVGAGLAWASMQIEFS
jgi:3-oxoacyl-[acyl-carrier-protein] synthase-3